MAYRWKEVIYSPILISIEFAKVCQFLRIVLIRGSKIYQFGQHEAITVHIIHGVSGYLQGEMYTLVYQYPKTV